MTAQPPVKHSGIGNIRLGVTSIYGIETKRGWKCVNTTQPLIITVLT